MEPHSHKVLTYIDYRAVSDVFQTIDPPTPSPPSECVLPPAPRRWVGRYTLAGRWGGGGVNISEDARHWIGLLHYNPSTLITNKKKIWKVVGNKKGGGREGGKRLQYVSDRGDRGLHIVWTCTFWEKLLFPLFLVRAKIWGNYLKVAVRTMMQWGSEVPCGQWRCGADWIRSVNHEVGDFSLFGPRLFSSFEDSWSVV